MIVCRSRFNEHDRAAVFHLFDLSQVQVIITQDAILDRASRKRDFLFARCGFGGSLLRLGNLLRRRERCLSLLHGCWHRHLASEWCRVIAVRAGQP